MGIAEVFKPVPGYEGVYSISDLGRVMRLTTATSTKAGHIFTPYYDKRGYAHVSLHKDGVKRKHRLHRLVMLAHVGPAPFPRAEVNHIDGNPSNNCLSNLEWTTASENVAHSYHALGNKAARGEQHGHSKLTESAVRDIRRLHQSGDHSQSSLAARFNVSQQTISKIVRGRRWQHLTPDPVSRQKE